MRITNNLAAQLSIADLSSAREQLDAAQRAVTSGHKWETPSQDPIAAASVMRNNEQLSALGQYQRNVSTASRRATLEESAIDQISQLLTQAKEIALAQSTATASASSRQSVVSTVNQLLAQAVQIANSKDGSEYLFGGDTPTTQPFTVDTSGAVYSFSVAAVAPSGPRMVEIDSGQTIMTNHDGTQAFGTTAAGPLKALADLAAALQGGTQAGVTGTLDTLDSELGKAQVLISDAGARANRLQMTSANISALTNQLTSLNSDLQDVEAESAMVDLVNRQTAFQAALAATSRTLGLSLATYLP
jgi:flagellar hook-associated protein 3 FlgL